MKSVWVALHSSIIRQSMAITALTLLFLVLNCWRAGVVPIASGGDDVWFSEAAYWLVQDGVLKREIHKNGVSNIRDPLPPVASLAQAAIFRIFGLSQRSMAAASIPAVAALIYAIMQIGRLLNMPRHVAMLLAISSFSLPECMKRLIEIRYDIYVAISILISLYFLIQARRSGLIGHSWLAGFFAGASVMSHYGFATPVALYVGWVTFERLNGKNNVNIAYFLGGLAVVAFIAAWWINPDWETFLMYLSDGARAYESAHRYQLAYTGQNIPWLHGTVFLMAMLGIYRCTTSNSNELKSLGILISTMAMSGAIITLGTSNAILPASYILAIISIIICTDFTRDGQKEISCLALASCASLGIMIYTALILGSQSGRNIDDLTSDLQNVINRRGMVLTDGIGWLPLREALPNSQLIHIIGYVNDASVTDKSSVLLDKKYADSITTVAIVPGSLHRLSGFPSIQAFLQKISTEGPIRVGICPYCLDVYRQKLTQPFKKATDSPLP